MNNIVLEEDFHGNMNTYSYLQLWNDGGRGENIEVDIKGSVDTRSLHLTREIIERTESNFDIEMFAFIVISVNKHIKLNNLEMVERRRVFGGRADLEELDQCVSILEETLEGTGVDIKSDKAISHVVQHIKKIRARIGHEIENAEQSENRSATNFLEPEEYIQTSLIKPTLELPIEAPERYKDRPGTGRDRDSAPKFLRRIWGLYLDAGVLYQYHLRSTKNEPGLNMDPELMTGIRSHCRRRGGVPEDFIPRTKERVDKEIQGMNSSEVNRIARAISRRRKA
jgi:hypothetical protein